LWDQRRRRRKSHTEEDILSPLCEWNSNGLVDEAARRWKRTQKKIKIKKSLKPERGRRVAATL